MADTIRILVADDHPVVREGLSAMLSRQADFEVVGQATDGREAVDLTRRLKPNVVLMDLKMPRLNGVEAIRQIKQLHSETEVLVLTTFDSDDYIFQGIEAGARGYLLKDAPREDLFRAVRAVAAGESLLQPNVAARLVNRFAVLSRQLSDRELEVLRGMARGLANKEIASELSIGETTVKTHVTNIFQKLGASDRTQAVTIALQRQLITL
ncbi:MAG TPA: response regulator transcription factor [Chloroflexota bacterium]|nr:response regulator transcription factor [Chloroflexota bacterium]